MKFRIGFSGELEIKRRDAWQHGLCYLRNIDTVRRICSDRCALFGEPEIVDKKIHLELCHGKTLKTKPENFTDERKK